MPLGASYGTTGEYERVKKNPQTKVGVLLRRGWIVLKNPVAAHKKKAPFLNSNFKVPRLACWNESKKGLVRNSGNLGSYNGSEFAVIFSKDLEVGWKRKVQICRQLWKPDRGARSWAWTTICNTFLHFPSVSHRDQMKEMKESEIKYYRNIFFHLGEGNFLEDFML